MFLVLKSPFLLSLPLIFLSILLLPSDLMWFDSGELAASAWELGIAHPPGFPHQLQINHLLMLLMPFGSIAFKAHLSSLLLGLLACYVFFVITQRLGCHPIVCLLSLLFLFSHPIARLHLLNHEVYSGLVLIYLLILVQCIDFLAQPLDPRKYLTLCFLFAFALGFHPEIRIFLLCFLCLILIFLGKHQNKLRNILLTRKFIGLVLLFSILGLVGLAYLIIRSRLGLMRNWGNPSDMMGFWNHFFAKRILIAFQDEIFNLSSKNIRLFLEQIVGGFGFFNLLLSPSLLIGLFKINKINKSLFYLFLVMMILDIVYSTYINPMGLRDQQNGLLLIFMLLLACAIGIDHIVLLFKSKRQDWLRGSLFLLSSACVLLQPRLYQYQKDHGFLCLINLISDQVQAGALVLSKSDHLSAGIAFLQVTEGWRLDIAALPRQHLWDPSAVEAVKKRRENQLKDWRPGDLYWLTQRKELPLYWEWGQGQDQWSALELKTDFPLLSRQHNPQKSLNEADILKIYQGIEAMMNAEISQQALAYFMADRADFMISQEQWLNAFYLFTEAFLLSPKNAIYAQNLGQIMLRLGDIEKAILLTELAYELNPDSLKIQVNLLRMYLNQNQTEKIKALILAQNQVPMEIDSLQNLPIDQKQAWSNFWGLLGVYWANQGAYQQAKAAFDKALTLDPEQIESKLYLPKLP